MTKTPRGCRQRSNRLLLFVAAMLSAFLIRGLSAHGDLHEQIEKLTQAIQDHPRDADLRLKQGELYRVHGDYKLALADYE